MTTGEDGVAESKPLYLGKYEIYETEAPFGMVINTEVHSAELVYAGQEIEITETAASFCNDRQKVQISLTKVMEQNKQFGIGMNYEMSAVTFGLYAGEELTAKDGKIIPADGLIEIISVDENGKAKAKSDLPFGNYYLKEISTDQHYILTDEKFSVSFEYAGQTVDVVDIKANDGKSISNELIYQNSSIAVQGFEETNLPDSFFDAAVGNVPFGQFKVPDKRYDKHNFLIHDYFFARTLDKVRPGGVVAFISSKGTMDKENPAVRKYIAQRADLLGAIRLPNDTFKAAAGTEVTSDIIFLQKRDRLIDIEPEWVHLATDENGIKMNSYFVNNFIVGMLYTQLFQQLYYQADSVHGGRLPVHVHFVMDEFANVALPDEFDKLLSTMRSREISVSIIIQNLAQLKALFEKQWESIVGNCDEFLYLGGNEQSTHEYVSKLLGKETIDTNTYGRSRGRNGNYSTNYQLAGRELMTPDEVRMLDNQYALLFIRGERPIQDLKYDILHHPNVSQTTDGGAPAYKHGEDTRSIASMSFEFDPLIVKQAQKIDAEKHDFVLLSEEELEELIDEKEKKEHEKP